ncbi:MAG: DinB/UmuC family translesion DNA polymerase [Pirellulaceae bacterium]
MAWRLRRHELRGRVVHLKVRFADFSLITRSQTLPEPTDITQELWQVSSHNPRRSRGPDP